MSSTQAVNPSLLRDSSFLKFWIGESVSWIGSQVTLLALPLVAISILGASTRAVGFLVAVNTVTMVVVTPFVGLWLDYHPVRPIIIATNITRSLILAAIPVAVCCFTLSMPLLYVIAFAVGGLTGIFDIAILTYVPRLVHEEQLVDANSKVSATIAIAESAGPALGGVLIHLFTAPMAILADVVSYQASTILLALIKVPERMPAVRPADRGVTEKWFLGLRHCLVDRRLRLLMTSSAWFNLCEQAIMTSFLVYAIRVLAISSTELGILLAAAGCGAIFGSLAATAVGRRLGPGRVLACGAWLAAASLAVSPIPSRAAVPFVLGPALLMYGFGVGLFNVHAIAYRQTITPNDSHGRMNAAYRLFTYGAMPLGAATAALLGQEIGTRATIAVAGTALVGGMTVFAVRAWWSETLRTYVACEPG